MTPCGLINTVAYQLSRVDIMKVDIMKSYIDECFDLIREYLSDDLRKPKYRGHPNKYRGHCYVACELLYHLAGKEAGFKPCVVRFEDGETHWFLRNEEGTILDPTADQFGGRDNTIYERGRGCGFLTRRLSKRARTLSCRIAKGLQDEIHTMVTSRDQQ